MLAGRNLSPPFQDCNNKIPFFHFPGPMPDTGLEKSFPISLAFLYPRWARQEEACASRPLSTIGKISATQDKVCSIRGGMFFFSLSRTNMKAPAMARP